MVAREHHGFLDTVLLEGRDGRVIKERRVIDTREFLGENFARRDTSGEELQMAGAVGLREELSLTTEWRQMGKQLEDLQIKVSVNI